MALRLPPVLLIALIFCALSGGCAAAWAEPHTLKEQVPIVILVPQVVLDALPQFLQVGEQAETFDDYQRAKNFRDLTDYLLLRRALALGGNTRPVELRAWTLVSYERTLSDLRQGTATLFSNGMWREDFHAGDEGVRVTSSVLAFGELEAGLYMNPHNPHFKQITRFEDLRPLTAVTSRQWLPDWNALESLHLRTLYDQLNFEHMLKMVHSQRADFMLIPFSATEDLNYTAIGLTLAPVPQVKVQLAGSRGWVVSRTHLAGEQTYNCLELGLAKLRAQGVIRRAYIGAGVINARVEQWQVLNPMPAH